MSDSEFREWIRNQPSALTGKYSEYVHGEGRCLACHVRRAGKSGTGYKAEYSCVPLTREEHDVQHRKGEVACLVQFLPSHFAKSLFEGVRTEEETKLRAKTYFDQLAEKYRNRWMEIEKKRRKIV